MAKKGRETVKKLVSNSEENNFFFKINEEKPQNLNLIPNLMGFDNTQNNTRIVKKTDSMKRETQGIHLTIQKPNH